MKRMILRTLQEDIDTGRHSAYWCPVALGMKRATGLRWAVSRSGAAVGEQEIRWPVESYQHGWIDRYDAELPVEPFEIVIEVPDEVPVLPEYAA